MSLLHISVRKSTFVGLSSASRNSDIHQIIPRPLPCTRFLFRYSQFILQIYSTHSGLLTASFSSVSIATGCGAAKDLFPAGIRNISLHYRVQTGSGVNPAFYSKGTTSSSDGVKRPDLEVDHSPPTLVLRSRMAEL
jgi:hypothetical protein